jgi:hypothetical protein
MFHVEHKMESVKGQWKRSTWNVRAKIPQHHECSA